MALRSFAYDDPNYTLTRQYCSEVADIASSAALFANPASKPNRIAACRLP